MPQTASEPAQQPERSDSAASKRTAPDDDRPRWRVEGARSAGTAGRAKRLLAEHHDKLDSLAEALLERETLEEADAYAVAGIRRPSASEPPLAVPA